jgi:hypothetical protein
MKVRFAALLIALSFAACGPPPPGGLAPVDRDFIGRVEIDDTKLPGWSAYDLILKLRPQFLRNRGATSFRNTDSGEPAVYLDGVRYGKPESLKQISADQVQSVQFLSAADATTRFGTDNASGAILIQTR